jgi:hypothetical protein
MRREADMPKKTIALDKALVHTKLQTDPYHIDLVHTVLTKNLTHIVGNLEDEITHAFSTIVEPKLPDVNYPDSEGGWCPLEWEDLKSIVARSANRTFVGVPQCKLPNLREKNWMLIS